MYRFLIMAAVLLVAGNAGKALAQTPQSTTATYEDWVVRCDTGKNGKHCEMTQSTRLKTNNRLVSIIAIGTPDKHGSAKMVFQVPVNVWLPTGISLLNSAGHAEVTTGFTRCVPMGCLVETKVDHSVLQSLRTEKHRGTLRFKEANKKNVVIPISFKGFDQAYDAILSFSQGH